MRQGRRTHFINIAWERGLLNTENLLERPLISPGSPKPHWWARVPALKKENCDRKRKFPHLYIFHLPDELMREVEPQPASMLNINEKEVVFRVFFL